MQTYHAGLLPFPARPSPAACAFAREDGGTRRQGGAQQLNEQSLSSLPPAQEMNDRPLVQLSKYKLRKFLVAEDMSGVRCSGGLVCLWCFFGGGWCGFLCLFLSGFFFFFRSNKLKGRKYKCLGSSASNFPSGKACLGWC